MSASASKKKRKELDQQGVSPKAVAAQKAQAQRSKTIRNTLIVVLAVVVSLALVFAVIKLVNRPDYDTKAAVATVGEEKVSVPVYDYFYNLSASNFYNSYSFLIQAGVPLSQQSSFFGGEGTMEDYLIESTNSSLQEILNVVAEAKKNGYTLTDEQKENVKSGLEAVKSEATAYGFSSTDKYLKARFGDGCDLSSYEEYLNLFMLYTGYATKLNEDFQPTAQELSDTYAADPSAYDLVGFTYMLSSAESTPVPATGESATDVEAETATGESATDAEAETAPTETTYTDEAKAAAKEKAEGYVKQMPEEAVSTTYTKANVTSYLNEEIAAWLFDDARKAGDAKVFARTEDETAFYTVRFDSRDTNDYQPVNANIISIAKDAEDKELAEGEQSSEEKKDALVAAVSDGMSDEDFSAAVTALGYTAGTNSITRTYSVEAVRDFLYGDGVKAGDVTLVETDTTYYLVRYASLDENTYRDTLVKNDLWNKFYEGIAGANTIEVNADLLQFANTDLTFNANTSES